MIELYNRFQHIDINTSLNRFVSDSNSSVGNISLVEFGDEYIMSVRQFPYIMPTDFRLNFNGKPYYYFVIVDSKLNIRKILNIKSRDIDARYLEDVVLYKYNDMYYLLGTYIPYADYKTIEILHATIHISDGSIILSDVYHSHKDDKLIQRIGEHGVLKNWMPLNDHSFVYKINNTDLMIYDIHTGDMSYKQYDFTNCYSGSTAFIPHKNYKIGVIHRKTGAIYYNRLIALVNNGIITSEEFRISTKPVEISKSIMISNDTLLIPYTTMDQYNYIFKANINDLFKEIGMTI